MASSSAALEPWRASFTWRLEGFSKLPTGKDDFVCSETFEAGVSSWRLLAFPGGTTGVGTHLSVDLQVVDDMWMPTASAALMLVNQTAGGRSHPKAVPAANFLLDDTLELTVDITVQREARFALDSGGMPSDLVLRLLSGAELPTHWYPLHMASKVLHGSPESTSLSVDGSLGTWTYILADLYPLHDAPALTLGGAYTVLPVAHKYGFTKLVSRLVDFIKGQSLESHPKHLSKYIISWVVLAGRLQLEELLVKHVKDLSQLPGDALAQALIKPDEKLPAALREQLQEQRRTEDPRLSFSTPEFKEAQRQFTDGFKKNFGRPVEWALVKEHPWSTPQLRRLDTPVDVNGNPWPQEHK
ncbi:hypothetical protein FOA52_012919 [Chlamydomonas sp. UWO 241]|nr:hypothetical protein FOA52_012919 [Chlamydomonas sp. UWO 241]